MTNSATTRPLVLRLQALKLRLARHGRRGVLLIPLVEVIEMWLTNGVRGVVARCAMRLGWTPARPVVAVVPLEPLPAGTRVTIPPMTTTQGVSIVIPVMNNAAMTYECLQSIAGRSPRGMYEVIVVDNASSDDTQDVLGGVDGVRVIRWNGIPLPYFRSATMAPVVTSYFSELTPGGGAAVKMSPQRLQRSFSSA